MMQLLHMNGEINNFLKTLLMEVMRICGIQRGVHPA